MKALGFYSRINGHVFVWMLESVLENILIKDMLQFKLKKKGLAFFFFCNWIYSSVTDFSVVIFE